jgi:uncharacterized LabA/DUF88 family protein
MGADDSGASRSRTIAYIDGFNLYYNAVKGTSWKWLDLEKYVVALRNNDAVVGIKYFTAPAEGPSRRNQNAYWKALKTLPLVKIIKGRHKRKERKCGVKECQYEGSRWFTSLEEKRTDVNIAVEMLDDAYQNRCDTLVLISGDSDLVPGVQKIRQRFPEKLVVVYVPNLSGDDGHHEIRGAAHKAKDLPINLFKHAQLPDRVSTGEGEFVEKPVDW